MMTIIIKIALLILLIALAVYIINRKNKKECSSEDIYITGLTKITLRLKNVDLSDYNRDFYTIKYNGECKCYDVVLTSKPGFLTIEQIEEIARKYNAEIISAEYIEVF